MTIIFGVLAGILNIVLQAAMYFVVESLEWQRFKQLWWIGPLTFIFEWCFWELFINVPHVIVSRKLVKNQDAFGGPDSSK